MNIIPEEPEIYTELYRPTPSLSSLLTRRQFEFYTKASTSHLLCTLRSPLIKKLPILKKALKKPLRPPQSLNQRSLLYIGLSVGILALTKIVKNLTTSH